MLKGVQIAVLVGLSVILWAAAAAYIHLLPGALTDPVRGALGFVTTFPMAWFSVWLIEAVGRLMPNQLLAGVGLVGAVAMMVDGIVLRWFPNVYGTDAAAVRLGAAWLLWGYGVSIGVAVCMSAWRARRLSVATY